MDSLDLLFKKFLQGWGDVRKDIESYLVPVERIARILTDLGSPRRFDELDPPLVESKIKFAFMNAPFIRRRVTFGDLLIFLNWDRDSLWQKAWAGVRAASGK